MKNLDESNFTKEVSKNLTIVDFFSEGCPPCLKQHKIFNNLEARLQDKISLAESKDRKLKEKFGIEYTPTIIFFFEGKEIKRLEGLQRIQDLKEATDNLIKQIKN